MSLKVPMTFSTRAKEGFWFDEVSKQVQSKTVHTIVPLHSAPPGVPGHDTDLAPPPLSFASDPDLAGSAHLSSGNRSSRWNDSRSA